MKNFTKGEYRTLALLRHETLRSVGKFYMPRDPMVDRISGKVIDALARRKLIVFGSGASYVRLSARGRRTVEEFENHCRRCGCTDTRACDGGCWWVEADLCSACGAWRVVYGEKRPAWEQLFPTKRDAVAFAKKHRGFGDVIFSITKTVPGEPPRSMAALIAKEIGAP